MKREFPFLDRGSLLCALLMLVTAFVYLPARSHGFVSYDDPLYVSANRNVQAGLTWSGVSWAFTTGHAGNWHPVTWLSHQLDAQIFGPGPAGPHLVNVLLHLANTALVFLVLRSITGGVGRSLTVAALFALHPLHVESVAWIAERKDVLSAFFFLLTLRSYAQYVQRNSKLDYGLAVGFFALALMSKPMVVTLPCVLLLLDYWPLRRSAVGWIALVKEKILFFALAAISSVATFAAQRGGGAVQSLANLPLGERVANAFIAYARYLGKVFWPTDLAVLYPHPGHWPMVPVAAAIALVVALCVGAIRMRRRAPFIATGWFWFCGMLVPTIGLIQVGDQAMADRYTYLPSIGLFILLVWSASEIFERLRVPKFSLVAGACVMAIACAVVTFTQLHHWRDSESLFRHTLAVTRGNCLAHNNLATALLEQHRTDEAITELNEALRLKPDYALAHVNLGSTLLEQGKADEAIGHFEAAIRSQPDFTDAHYNLGNALLQKGNAREAVIQFQKATELSPEHVMAQNNLANTLLQVGDLDGAIVHYRAALGIWPEFVMARHNLGMALLQRGQIDEAVSHFRKIVELQPAAANVRNNLGWMLHQAGQLDEAVVHYHKALEMQPDYAEAHDNLARTLWRRGDTREALEHFRAAVKLQPRDPQNLADLAWALATCPDAALRNGAEAMDLARDAEQITKGENPLALRALAAAWAETGRFTEAKTTAQRVLALAESQSNARLLAETRSQLERYEAGAPFREGGKSE